MPWGEAKGRVIPREGRPPSHMSSPGACTTHPAATDPGQTASVSLRPPVPAWPCRRTVRNSLWIQLPGFKLFPAAVILNNLCTIPGLWCGAPGLLGRLHHVHGPGQSSVTAGSHTTSPHSAPPPSHMRAWPRALSPGLCAKQTVVSSCCL